MEFNFKRVLQRAGIAAATAGIGAAVVTSFVAVPTIPLVLGSMALGTIASDFFMPLAGSTETRKPTEATPKPPMGDTAGSKLSKKSAAPGFKNAVENNGTDKPQDKPGPTKKPDNTPKP